MSRRGLPAGVEHVLVLGASRSGISAALALSRLGLRVTISDRNSRDALPGLEEVLGAGVRFVAEGDLGGCWPAPDLVVKSPGVPGEAAPVVIAREEQVPVWSEVELAYALFPNPFDAVTGTNGKTTTTALLGHLFAAGGRPARVLGNIGVAVTSVAGSINPDEELVVEVSSFQLEDVHAFRPAAAVFLNFAPDHLDRHGTMERYLACKANLFMNQRAEDSAILNLADPAVATLGVQLAARSEGPRVAYFSVHGRAPGDRVADHTGVRTVAMFAESWVEGGWIYLEGEPVLPVDDIQLPGLHNLENCLAAGATAIARGVEKQAVAEGLRTFAGVPHRLERAGIISGVTYVNDSKATNVEATLTAIKAYAGGIHLILGGRDKSSDYRPIARACAHKCKAVYLIGEATPLIQAAFAEVRSREGREGLANVPEPEACGALEGAVRAAAERAVPGDVVLLAPACASFDQYGDFEERGEHFRHIVAGLSRRA